MTTDTNFEYCHDIMKKYSKSFSFAFDQLPENERRAVWAIYAVCRVIDDSIDVYQDPEYLKRIERDISVIEQQTQPQTFQSDERIMQAMLEVSKEFTIEYQSLYNLIDAVYQDQQFEQFETDEGLLKYCYGVAGTVGEVLTPILAHNPTEKAFEIARKLGEALQLTNILRDVGEDYENGRIYLSRSRLDEFQVSIEEQYHQGVTKEYIEVWEFYAKLAEDNYDQAIANLDVFNQEAQPIVELAAVIYRGILDEVRKVSYDLHKRAYVSKFKKVQQYKKIKKKYNI